MSDCSIAKVYEFYEANVRDAVSSVQATSDSIPMEFLIEIYAAFDDMKSFYVDGEKETEVAKEVLSHLKRATLDCYKTHLVLFNKDVQKLEDNYELTLLDNGNYYPKFLAKKHEIYKFASEARAGKPRVTVEQEFDLWKNIFNRIYDFRQEMIGKYESGVQWARKESRVKKTKADIKNLLIGFVSGILSGICLMKLAL
ncbi:MAG: hypothetical protein FWC26_14430 [Fibromonadales bacterium]|nr:hypothetical protein [Fibromonadales bacterium]